MVEIAASRSRWRAAEILAASAALVSAAAGFSFSLSAVFAAINQFSSMLGKVGQTVKSGGSDGDHEIHETHERKKKRPVFRLFASRVFRGDSHRLAFLSV